ncbi:Scr1 family TA system antitoxin-like transcriptional regulator [Streptomyces antibioticus]
MPPRATPSERQKRLGAELRKMRLAAQVSTEYAAGLLGIDRAKISNIEADVRVISPEPPGLLQTDAYARTLFAAALPPLSRAEVELRVALRLQRQQVLHREDPIGYVGYVHEAALRVEFGGAKVMRAQLDQLCELSESENIDVRVIPFRAGAFPGAGQAVIYAEGPVPQLDTVELDSAHGPEFLHGQSQLDKYRSHLDWMESASLSPADSRDFMHRIAGEL